MGREDSGLTGLEGADFDGDAGSGTSSSWPLALDERARLFCRKRWLFLGSSDMAER